MHLKVPPVAVAAVAAALMVGLSRGLPQFANVIPYKNAIALVIFLAGLGIAVSGVVSFRRRETTLNPTRPSTASSLVASGVYRFSRNPMYLGLLLALAALGVYLTNPLVLVLGVAAFVLYMNKYQIEPEEQALLQLFGEAFIEYNKNTRRWF